jgi:hypothetical protein
MVVLLSIHVIHDVPVHHYADRAAALADQSNWTPADVNSALVGFAMVSFGPDGTPQSTEYFDLADGTEGYGPQVLERLAWDEQEENRVTQFCSRFAHQSK